MGNLLLGLLAFSLSAGLTFLFSLPGSPLTILDHPNERSLHTVAVPRTGGLAMLAALLVTGGVIYALAGGMSVLPMLGTAVGGVSAVSFMDDRFCVHPGLRLLVHLAAALLLAGGGMQPGMLALPGWHWEWPVWVALPFTVLFVVWMINLYNFMDGMDGFAAGMAVAGFGTFALLGWQAGDFNFMLLNLFVAAAALGFLIFNFPPARIFMGDVGSSLLGLLAAAMSLWADVAGIFPLWLACLVFSPFIVDATVTLLRRFSQGEVVWEAHRSHYYQRLVQLGWGHRRTVLLEYALMAACSLSALVLYAAPAWFQWAGLCLWAVIYLLLALNVHRLESGRGPVVSQ